VKHKESSHEDQDGENKEWKGIVKTI